MTFLVFDPAGTAESIPDMIKNDTLIEVLDEDQLSKCLKYITLSVDDALYILDQVQTKYKVPDRFKAVHHIFADFGKDDKFDCTKFVQFIRSLGTCLHFDILDSIAATIESIQSKNDQLSAEIKQILQNTATKSHSHPQTQTQQTHKPQRQKQPINLNIETLKRISKIEGNFNRIYKVCQKIAAANDKNAMEFAVREKYVYVTEKGKGNDKSVLTRAAYENNQNIIRLMIESNVDINAKDKLGSTALIEASANGHHDLVKLLLDVPGIKVNSIDKDKSTALMWASYFGYDTIVNLLVQSPGIDINGRGKNNLTALDWASSKGHSETVKILKSHGAK